MSLFAWPLGPHLVEGKVTVAPRPLRGPRPPRRTMPFQVEPGFYEDAEVWLYGNARLLQGHLTFVASALGPNHHSLAELNAVEAEAERYVLDSKVLVCGIHSPAHKRAAIVPLRWGSPRILVLSGGFSTTLARTSTKSRSGPQGSGGTSGIPRRISRSLAERPKSSPLSRTTTPRSTE